jgi:thiosulfate reductase cytochrome b subunit
MMVSGKHRRFIAWLLAGVSILLVLTGLGITRYEVITPLTLGLLDKALSYKIHVLLWGPFLILVVLHVYLNTSPKKRS